MNRRTFLITAALLGAAARVEAQDGRTWNARGRVTAIRRERHSITIDHEPIEGLMPAMRMPFRVADDAMLDRVSVGDRVAFVIARREGGGYVIRSIRRL